MQANRSFRSCLVQGAKGCWGLLLGYSPTSSLPLPHRSLTCIQSQPAFLPPNLYYVHLSRVTAFSPAGYVPPLLLQVFSSTSFHTRLSNIFPLFFPFGYQCWQAQGLLLGTLPALFSLKVLHVLCIRKASPIPIQPFHCVFLSTRLQLTFLSFSAHI